MALLEMVREKPDWRGALAAALILPPGVRERRVGQDHWSPQAADRPRRVSDDLAWLRQALDDPERHGLRPLPASAAVAAWQAEDDQSDRLGRLEARGVLDAAGFLLHGEDLSPALA